MLPERNQVAGSVYEAKKIIYPLGLEVERIHACKNSCVLFRGEYKDLDNSLSVGSIVSRGQKMAEIIMLRMGTSLWRSEEGRVTEGVL
jgi:hypothetical protein